MTISYVGHIESTLQSKEFVRVVLRCFVNCLHEFPEINALSEILESCQLRTSIDCRVRSVVRQRAVVASEISHEADDFESSIRVLPQPRDTNAMSCAS